MTSAGFGRRIIEPGAREFVLVPGREAPSPAPELNHDELKQQIRTALMSRIDPSVAVRIPRTRLRAEITNLVSEIATEQRIQLNEIEEATLAAELTNDMIGLGPLEPYLEDDEVTESSSMVLTTSTSSATANSKRRRPGFAMPSTLSASLSASPLQSAAVLMKRARWSMRASPTAAALISSCRRSC